MGAPRSADRKCGNGAEQAERRAGGGATTSARRLAANRANARKSTGPRTAVGKARSARNACRHDLTLPVLRYPALSGAAAALGRIIAGADADAERQEAACRIAEAQIDLRRIQRVRWQLIAELQRHLRQDPFADDEKPAALIRRLAALDRYERSARMRRQRAMRAFDTIGLPPPPVRQPDLTKPISDAALRRMAGWKNPLAEFLRGYPGLLRDLRRTNPMRSAARRAWPSVTRRSNGGKPRPAPAGDPAAAASRNSAQTNPAAQSVSRPCARNSAETNPTHSAAVAPAQALKTIPPRESAMTAEIARPARVGARNGRGRARGQHAPAPRVGCTAMSTSTTPCGIPPSRRANSAISAKRSERRAFRARGEPWVVPTGGAARSLKLNPAVRDSAISLFQ